MTNAPVSLRSTSKPISFYPCSIGPLARPIISYGGRYKYEINIINPNVFALTGRNVVFDGEPEEPLKN
jgi:hypothetical protein